MNKLIINKSLLIFFALALVACGKARKEESVAKESSSEEPIVTNGFISSTAAKENSSDTSHKFIRTADLKFRVNSVVKSTYKIEKLISVFDGFVTNTELASTINYRTVDAISIDSSLETVHFTVSNVMILRVPNTKLDTALNSIATFIDFLDYRKIKADDVGLQILSNRLTQKRIAKHEKRVENAIDEKGKKLNETVNAEESIYDKQEQSDNSSVSNLSLLDQINYSTITLSIYQGEETKRWVVQNDKNIAAYEPNFASQLFESFKFGWNIFTGFTIFIAKLWELILFALIFYFGWKMYLFLRNKKRFNAKNKN